MRGLAQICLLISLSCSRPNSNIRSESRADESSSVDSSSSNVQASDKPVDDSEGMPGFTKGKAPVPITGTNLVEVQVSVACVTSNRTTACLEVRMKAKVKVGSEDPISLAANTVNTLGILSYSWNIPALPNIRCISTGSGYDFMPKCTSSNGTSLDNKVIGASLTLVSTDGKKYAGTAPNSAPQASGNFFGDFLLLDSSYGLTPSGLTHNGAAKTFSQVWLDVVGGVYITNFLYEGQGANGTTNWEEAITLCDDVRLSDGTRGWKLPTRLRLESLYSREIASHIPTVVGAMPWSSIPFTWSSTEGDIPDEAWSVSLTGGGSSQDGKAFHGFSVLCIR